MKKTWLSLALGFTLAFGAAVVASACPYHQTSASNDASPPAQTATAGQASQPLDN